MWARVSHGEVKEITEIDPEGRYHPDIIWKPCESEVQLGWIEDLDAFKPPVPNAAALAEVERIWRDHYLLSTEWLMARHRDELSMGLSPVLANEEYVGLLSFRQQLRDWPAADGFPDHSKRPIAPKWLANL